jgi:glycogen debranching enzyme
MTTQASFALTTDPALAPFQIAAVSSLQAGRPQALKQGDTFAVLDRSGDVVAGPDSPEGLFHRDTRHLSRFTLTLAGKQPLLLSSTLRDDNVALTCDLTNPDLVLGGAMVEHDLVHLRRTKLLWNGAGHERLAIRSFAHQPLRLELEIAFAADFADLFEVRGTNRARRGTLHPPERQGDAAVVLSYTGLDAVRRATALRFDPAPARLDADRAVFALDLPPGGRALLFIETCCAAEAPDEPDAARSPKSAGPKTVESRASGGERFMAALHGARRAMRTASSRSAAVETSNALFNEVLRRSVSDLYMLVTQTGEGAYPYAGIPWFSAPFGRDALITALQTLWTDPLIARGVLAYLAANQATATDPAADAEPGKILHEVRQGEMAELGEVPFRRYYGSVDATPLFVVLAGAYLDRTNDLDTLRALWPHIESALAWMDTRGDRDGDGFIEYYRMTGKGLQNQGWKDSHDSIFHADGTLAEGPIALCEVQAYAFAARRAAADVAQRLGHAGRAAALRERAETLRQRFEAAFWCEDIGTYALALDGAKQPCRVRTSNAGHALFAGIAAADRARRVASQLLGSASFSGWGIRTVASGEARYNPMSYHDGSVWPHDNALIGMGFGRYGMRREAARVLEALFDASGYVDLRRLPELFCGFPRRRAQGPTLYPVACAPQAWAAVTPLGLLQACLGIGFDPASRAVTFDRPLLPAFLDEVILHGLAVGDARVDLTLRRAGDQVGLTVLANRGDARVILTR